MTEWISFVFYQTLANVQRFLFSPVKELNVKSVKKNLFPTLIYHPTAS